MKDFNRILNNIPKSALDMKTESAVECLMKRPLLIPSAVLFAVCCANCLTDSLIPLFVLGAGLVSLCVLMYRKRNVSGLGGLVMCIALSAFCSIRIQTALRAQMPSDTDGFYYGTIVSAEKKLSGTERLVANINGVNVELRFNKDMDVQQTVRGAGFKATGKMREPDPAGNPGEFDYKAYLKGKGIIYQFYADSFTYLDYPDGLSKAFLSFPDLCYRMRKAMLERFTYGRTEEEKALFAAVCLGDTSFADDSVIRDFRLSGCSHLLAVSGTHFAGFLFVLPYLLALLCPERKKSSLIYTFFTLLVGCITGWSESVTRSAVMSSCAFIQRDSLSAMSAAVMVMLVSDPFCSCRTGFLLSFSACLAIKLLASRIGDLLSFLDGKKALAKAFSVQIAAMMGTMPFTGMIQSRFGLAQFISQALGSFLAKGACIMFVPGVILSYILPKEAGTAVSAPSALFLGCLKKTVEAGSRFSLEMSSGKPVKPIYVFGIWLFLFLMLMPGFSLKRPLLKFSYALLALCAGLVIAGIIRPVNAEIVFADVGQGDCCLIKAGDTTCLIDSGTYEEGEKAVSDLLDYYGIAKIDVAFMTHWDQDHAGGLAALHKAGRINKIYTGFTGNDGDTEAFEKSVSYRNCDPALFRKDLEKTSSGDIFKLSDKVSLKVIYPSECVTGGNPGSLVMVMDCCGKKILFTGDIGLEEEEVMVSGNTVPDVDILKVSHHGSKYASSNDFLSQAKPEISVISVGKHNYYGHPNPKALERLEKAGSKIFRTDKDGAVIFRF